MKNHFLRGWAMFKDGKPHTCTLEKTKRSLLIGYDLMPLRGLAKTEKHLRSKGYEAKRATARIATDGEPFDAIVPVVNGKLVAELLSWSNWTVEIEQSLSSATLYFTDRLPVGEEVDQLVLRKFFWTPRQQIKRREQRAAKAKAVLEKSGITLLPIVIQPEDKERM